MYILLNYSVGVIIEGVVLARGRDRLRVVATGIPDTIELRRSGANWFTATQELVEIDFLMSHHEAHERVISSKTESKALGCGVH
jgi:hypothetical protein